MTTWITICDTCKRTGWEETGRAETDGEQLAALIEPLAGDDVETRRHSCLMGCTRGCNVAIQAADKIGFTLGEFTPDTDAAQAIIGYARLHAQSETGQVPYRQWPEGVKGHFITRHPPLPKGE